MGHSLTFDLAFRSARDLKLNAKVRT